MRRTIALAALAALLPSVGAPADPAASVFPAGWRQGWARSIEGRKLAYRWGYPGYASSLLCRAVDPTWAIEWEGEAPPAAGPDETVTYVWHVGLNSGASPHRFELQLGARPLLTFDTAGGVGNGTWTIEGSDGAILRFLTTRIGSFDERFGFMALTLVRRQLGTHRHASASCPRPRRARTTCSSSRSRSRHGPTLAAEEAVLSGGGRSSPRRQPPRPRRAREREGRGTEGPPGRARDRPLPHRHRRARGRHGVGPGRDRSGGSDPSWTRRWPSARSRPARSTSCRTRTWTSATRTRSRRSSASNGGTCATRFCSSRRRGTCPRGAVPLASRGPLGGGELPRPGERDGAARLAEVGEAWRPSCPPVSPTSLYRSLPPRGARPSTDASRRLKRRYGVEASPVAMRSDVAGLAWPA